MSIDGPASCDGTVTTRQTPTPRGPNSPQRAFKALLQDLVTQRISVPSLLQEAMKPERDMEQRPPKLPEVAWVKEGEEVESPGPAPEQQPGEVEQFQPLWKDPGRDRTQEQDCARGCFHRAAQMVCEFSRCIWREETLAMGAGGMANSALYNAKTSTALLDLLVHNGVSNAKKVPALVRYIHWWLTSSVSAEHRLDKSLLQLVEAQPVDVVVTLLRSAPSCDRAAVTMWRTIISSRNTAESALKIFALVLGSWPACSMCTSDGDERDVCALAVTVALWKILQMLVCSRAVRTCFPQLFVHLLFQVFFSTEHMLKEVDTFWRECRKQGRLPANPNRLAVLTIKALLSCLQCETVLMAMECKHGWDTLLHTDTHHYAVGLLARLAYLDVTECGEAILQTLSRHLWSECPEMRHQVLRGLVVLSKDPVMAKRMGSLTESLVPLLWDKDEEVVGNAVTLLSFLFMDKDIRVSSPTSLQLAEAFQLLFDNEDSSVQLSSILLFSGVMMLLKKEGKKPLKPQQNLLPLFVHCHDENQRVAQVRTFLVALLASREALLCVAGFLKRRDLKRRLKKKELWTFSECLVRTADMTPQPQ
ncbi:uncharacterized protein LOC126652763 [Myiozetetes cayanensis]|uniref:uncharacterized protein LOC126652763 n=1 Tax=Myiozetetes cayanensis TaxID=478635 RepID=UPI00215F5F2E|nr:uncharacterized protein LOC126652763 [Myiozetetes cayanensis]